MALEQRRAIYNVEGQALTFVKACPLYNYK